MEVESKRSSLIVAHRGASHAAPENTLPAFKLAFEEQADFIEGDFWMTADQHLVCIHDPDTKRVPKAEVNIDVRRATLQEIKEVDVGLAKGAQFKGTTIPTLEEILTIIPPGKGIFIEIKDTRPQFLELLRNILNEFNFKPIHVRLIAFDPDVVNKARQQFPDFKIYWLYNWYLAKETGTLSNTPKEILRMVKLLPCDGLNINPFPWIDLQFVKKLRRLNKDFCVYNVNSFGEALKLVTLGVDAIATNCPGKIRQQLNQYFSPKPLLKSQNEELKVGEDRKYIFRNHPIK